MLNEKVTYKVVKRFFPYLSDRSCYYQIEKCKKALNIPKDKPLYTEEFKEYFRLK